MVRAVVAVVIAAGFLSLRVGRAQGSRWEEQVTNLLNTASKTFAGKGFKQTHEPKTAALHNLESETFYLDLNGGTDYSIVGVCDSDCDDLDLSLYNDHGDTVYRDTLPNAVPVVVVSPLKTAKYRIKVIMASCKSSPCWYGLGVYGK